MSEARSSRISRTTDFSIARILSIGDRTGNATPEVGAFDLTVNLQGIEQNIQQDARQRRRRVEFVAERDHRNQEISEEKTSRRGEEKREEEQTCPNTSGIVRQRSNDNVQGTDLMWLQYTRYRPPKLPRRSFVEKRRKRREGDHPRIPFTSSQLQVLEDKYRRGAYLSRNDVVEMSATLKLPQSKVRGRPKSFGSDILYCVRDICRELKQSENNLTVTC